MKPNKTDAKAVAKALEADHPTVGDAAMAALEVAWERHERAGKYLVIVQAAPASEDAGGVERDTFALGPYRTLAQARSALSATLKAASRWMVVETCQDTAHAWFARRRDEQEAADLAAHGGSQAERLVTVLKARGDICPDFD